MHNPIQQLSLVYYDALASLRRSRNWLPLLVFWCVQGLGLWIVTALVSRPQGASLVAFLQQSFDPEVGEYPRFYLLLPDIHRRLYLVLAATLGAMLQGVCQLQLLSYHTKGKLQREHPWRRALRRWPGLFLFNLLALICFLVPFYVVHHLPERAAEILGHGRKEFVLAYGGGFAAEVLLLYAPLLYVSFSSGWWTSLRSSVVFALRHFGTSLLLVFIPFVLTLPLRALSLVRRIVVLEFRPELMFYALLATSFLGLLVLFLQFSSAVRYYAETVLRRPFMGEWDDKHEAHYPELDAQVPDPPGDLPFQTP
ncbi:MAG: hypothetical protein H6693_10685 [Candidatus Latescibacteria bacterium]|nr:hypothetical protein [Candidatus Latescibacterota bacterium]